VFVVNVLGHGQLELARHFGTQSAREVDKLTGIAWRPARTGAPILADALAFFDCELTGHLPAGDHEILLDRVIDGALLMPDAPPLSNAETGDMDGSSALYPPGLS